MNQPFQFETIAVRTQTQRTQYNEHSSPLYLTSSFVFDDAEQMSGAFAGENDATIYSRFSNPNTDEFIQKMPLQYETNIGDNGVKLSGGEQQRLSIARAIYKNAPILILDEATSHLDSNSEKLVQDALQNLLKDKTAIIIAHRLSTVQFADEIIVLKEGEIIEQGTHQQLMLQNGEYKKLVDLQQL